MDKLIFSIFRVYLLLFLSVIVAEARKDDSGKGSVIIIGNTKEETENKDGATGKKIEDTETDGESVVVTDKPERERTIDDKTKNLVDSYREKDTDFADCLEFKFGDKMDSNPIEVYVVPTCLHCGMFLAEDLDKFLKEYGQLYGIIVRFIVPTKKDLFILKLFYNKFLDYKWKGKEEKYEENKYKMYWQYIDYVKKVIATAKNRQDPDMEDLKKIALKFGFDKGELEEAEPNPKGKYEEQIIAKSADYTRRVTEISELEEIKTPCIIKGEEELEDLEEATSTTNDA